MVIFILFFPEVSANLTGIFLDEIGSRNNFAIQFSSVSLYILCDNNKDDIFSKVFCIWQSFCKILFLIKTKLMSNTLRTVAVKLIFSPSRFV